MTRTATRTGRRLAIGMRRHGGKGGDAPARELHRSGGLLGFEGAESLAGSTRRIDPFNVLTRAPDPPECRARSPRRPTPTRSACWPRRNCSGCASTNRAHCARVNTPQWRWTRTIHPARRPVQPSGSSALPRPRGRAMAPLTADFNSCSSTSMLGTLRSRSQGSQPLGNVPMSQEVSGRFKNVSGPSDTAASGVSERPRRDSRGTRLGLPSGLRRSAKLAKT